ncbi:MAG TPA: glycosyltransferase family 4 protein [Candidatus Limnocylindria bacterium]|nr:glycosyltransferase family 4 protein [Candidatus Limnocylindria bacterium]
MDVALLTLGDPDRMSGGSLFDQRLAERAPQHSARVTFCSVRELAAPLPLLASASALRRIRRSRPDVLVVDSIAATYVAPWLPVLRRPAAALIHQPPGGVERRAIGAWLDRATYRQLDLLLATGPELADELAPLGVPVRVLPPGRDAPIPDEDVGDLRRGRGAAILCVANWLPAKGIVELVEAFAALPDEAATLHLVGGATDAAYAGRLRARLAQHDLRDRVVVHGALPPAAVAATYRAADVFALPSYSETYGMAWAEAMDAGLPVVGWRATNLPNLVDHEREGLLVEAGDVAALAAALRRLVDDAPLRRRLGANARRRASARATWDQTAEAFFAALRRISR